ncbi:vitamin K epoxide reductase complex subunit 1 isoform X2 [Manduca sexta]|uniref:vitamin K epoxide reductase complex subunit 1 isoform X2 n=1 Tax=Manduca sexta TaxID=7130 RepID=UPI00118343C3|nr:vitamin K epoxide reductase complex subunit 1 isoform X2 [Manduca sexta]
MDTDSYITAKMELKNVARALTLTCILGIFLSTYALYVEMAVEIKPGYKALCDISEHASCSKVLSSKYAKGFGLMNDDSALKIPNCIYGTIFYCLMIFLTTFDQLLVVRFQFLLGAASILMCVYLAYLLAFVLHDFCLVCVSTYVVNGFLVYFTTKKMRLLSRKNA